MRKWAVVLLRPQGNLVVKRTFRTKLTANMFVRHDQWLQKRYNAQREQQLSVHTIEDVLLHNIETGRTCLITEEWQGTFIGRRHCHVHNVRWDDGGSCPKEGQ